jgi:glycosyltransferase involved in cell wall biosynthesis
MNGFSIIIAAHNEASVIEQTLRSILANRLDRALQIIVVANGCSDDTAARARAFSPLVEVIETDIAGKIHALNLGDQAAHYFPRAYLDADIDLTDNVLQKVADAFTDPDCRVACPTARHTYTGDNVLLAGYYRLWSALPYVKNAVMGMGFYAIDAAMRGRFDQFPPITADDKFVHSLAAVHERRIVPDCYATVKMPRTFGHLLRVKTRWTYGNLELAANYRHLARSAHSDYQGAAAFLLRRPRLWVNVPTFVFVYLYSRSVAHRRFAQKNHFWERDDSTRPMARESRPAA